ncbi:hypothetical protein HY379_00665 [Candidatus Saccharibacteria bacterium]|nr:hypothetical protein [Candidatus Saccharibacteria bacterium]
MIATSVFSILLLLSLAGFLQIGQLFYKGVNITRTSDVSNQIMSAIKDDISFDTGTATIARQPATPVTEQAITYQRFYFCAGFNRYAGVLGRLVNSDEAAAELNGGSASNAGAGWYKFGLLKEKYSGVGCPNPFSGSGTRINKDNATVLLGDNMRLSNLTITSPANSLYTLNVHIAYGINEVLTNPPTSTAVKCQSGASFSRYCFVTDVKTTVRQGLQP